MKKEVKIKQETNKGKFSWLISSLLCFLVGLALVIWTAEIASAANYILGSIILVVGIIYLAISLWGKQGSFFTGFGIVFSVVLICIGVFMMLKPEIVLSIFPMIVGGIIVIHGIIDLKKGIELFKNKYRYWWVALIIAAVTIGLGVVLLFNPFSVVTLAFRIIGVILIVDGASDFWIGLQARRTEKNKDIQNAKSEILEVTAEEK